MRSAALFTLITLLYLSVAIFSRASEALAGAAEGEKIFTAKRCAACHRTEGPVKVTLTERLKEKGPDLWYAGSRFKREFLLDWLKSPKAIRPMAYNSLTIKNRGDHARLSKEDAASVTDYLMTLKSPLVRSAGIKPNTAVKGRFIFQKKLGCYGCHMVRRGSKVVGGLTGPALIGASKMLQPDWIYAYLKDPKAFTPATPMPIYRGLVSDSDLRALAGFVAGME
ncbi:MAG: c-type cytochrome [Thermodesulfobacteriota bacterium]